MAIYDYWKIKDALNQYNELEEHTLEILDTMEDMTDVYKKYMKCIFSKNYSLQFYAFRF